MNKKILPFLIGIITLSFTSLRSIYTIDVQTLDGSTINLGSFVGKKMIITEFDALTYDKAQLAMLDSIQQANKEAVVIALPAKDFGGTTDTRSIQKIINTQNLSFIVLQPAFVKKTAGSDQHPLFKWLTDVNENSHFDYDADQPGQIFMVSEDGDLYAVLYKAATNDLVKETVSQKTN